MQAQYLRLAEFLSLLHAKAEGRSDAEMAREICKIDPSIDQVRAIRIVKARLKEAKRLANNPQRLLVEAGSPTGLDPQSNKVR